MDLKRGFTVVVIFVLMFVIGMYSFCNALHSTYKFHQIDSVLVRLERENILLQNICDTLIINDSIKQVEISRLIKEKYKQDSLYQKEIKMLKNSLKRQIAKTNLEN